MLQNSRCLSEDEHLADTQYGEVQRQCVEVAKLLQCTAPIRVDARRFKEHKFSPFASFDVNMKPVSRLTPAVDDMSKLFPEHDRSW